MGHGVVLVDQPIRVAQGLPQLRFVQLVPGHGVVGAGLTVKAGQQLVAGVHALFQLLGVGGPGQALAPLGHVLGPADGHIRPILADGRPQGGQILGPHKIVRVHKGKVGRFCRLNACIPCAGKAAVGLVQHPHPGVLFGVFLAQGAAVVRASVVHQDQFKIPEGLVQNAVYAGAKPLLHFINGYDHTDFRHDGTPPLLCCFVLVLPGQLAPGPGQAVTAHGADAEKPRPQFFKV